jgi:hypothetical protein
MNTNWNRVRLAALLCLATVFCGCASTGIRKLENVELNYYQALARQLANEQSDLAALRNIAATEDELAMREITRLEFKIQAAKTVYSVREMLTAPAGNNAAFIQNTRNRVLLNYLAEAAHDEDQRDDGRKAELEAFQARLADLEDQLLACVQAVIESEKLLHNHLNKNSAQNLQDVFAEVENQLGNFDAQLKNADQNNPFIKTLKAESQAVSSGVKKTDAGLEKLMEIWSKLNK